MAPTEKVFTGSSINLGEKSNFSSVKNDSFDDSLEDKIQIICLVKCKKTATLEYVSTQFLVNKNIERYFKQRISKINDHTQVAYPSIFDDDEKN